MLFVACIHLCCGAQESEKAHFNPTGLVRSLRDWEGQPLDVMVQQDASEFLTQFFQQVSDYAHDGRAYNDDVNLPLTRCLDV